MIKVPESLCGGFLPKNPYENGKKDCYCIEPLIFGGFRLKQIAYPDQ
jgi:hypothetical protein